MNTFANKLLISVLLVGVLIDFLTRLTVELPIHGKGNKSSQTAASVEFKSTFYGLSKTDIDTAFAWATDDKPFVKPSQAIDAIKPVEAAAVDVPIPVEPPKEDPVELLAKSITGDRSKTIQDNQLLTLKGIFFETGYFAVIEVMKISDSSVSYHKVRINEQFAGFSVNSINRYQIRLQASEQPVILSLFESGKG